MEKNPERAERVKEVMARLRWDMPGAGIEKESFRTIEREFPEVKRAFPGREWIIARRLIHTTSDPSIALASATAFAVSECIDWLVFSITRRPLHDRLWISSALSIPLDTFIFFGMIDALTPGVILTALGSKFAGVTAVWLIMAWRLRKQALVS